MDVNNIAAHTHMAGWFNVVCYTTLNSSLQIGEDTVTTQPVFFVRHDARGIDLLG